MARGAWWSTVHGVARSQTQLKRTQHRVKYCVYLKEISGLMHETGCSGLVHWDDPGGWDGERGGRGFWMGNTCASVADSCQCLAKTTTIF